MPKIRWYDWLVYRLFHWRWGRIFASRPDLREIFLQWVKTYDVVNEGQPIKVTVTIEKPNEET